MPIPPGSTIGILGGGQLGRMTAMAARSYGYRVQVLDPDPSCPARFVVDACFEANWDDAAEAAALARGSDVVTLEIEQVAIASINAAAKYAPVRPGAHILEVIQDRIAQRQWLASHGFPVGDFRACTTADELAAALHAFRNDVFIKAARGGYDGRAQLRLTPAKAAELSSGWSRPSGLHTSSPDRGALAPEISGVDPRLGESASQNPGALAADVVRHIFEHDFRSRPVIVERALDLHEEISVLVARRPAGDIVAYPPAMNHHEKQILVWSVLPAQVPPDITARATEIAISLADQFQLEGLLVAELFLTTSGDLLVNELAPRPHNSYHQSERACATSQFEQHVRSVCDLPLGSPHIVRPAAIVNLLGDLWLTPQPPDFAAALTVPEVRLHLYEKHVPKPARKMGHLSASADTPEEAVRRVLAAKQLLGQQLSS